MPQALITTLVTESPSEKDISPDPISAEVMRILSTSTCISQAELIAQMMLFLRMHGLGHHPYISMHVIHISKMQYSSTYCLEGDIH